MERFPSRGAEHWSAHVPPSYRDNLFRTLEELSRLGREAALQFVIIGALSLMIKRRLNYTSVWDVDILFKDQAEMERLIALEKGCGLEVQHFDERPMVSPSITSLHAAWRAGGPWLNVDYIIRDERYAFYRAGVDREGLYREEFRLGEVAQPGEAPGQPGRTVSLALPLAHPWDIFVDKVLSPRFEEEFLRRDVFSLDIKHVLIMLEQDGKAPSFWEHITGKGGDLGALELMESRLESLLLNLGDFGYTDIALPPDIMRRLEALR